MSVTHDHLYIINAKQDHVLLSYCTMQYYNAKEIYTTQLKFIKHHTEDVTIGGYSSGWMPVLCSLRYCTSQKEHSTGIQPLETDSVTEDICVQRYASLTLKCLIVIAGSVTQVLLAGTSAMCILCSFWVAGSLSGNSGNEPASVWHCCHLCVSVCTQYTKASPTSDAHVSQLKVCERSLSNRFPSSCQCVSVPLVRIPSYWRKHAPHRQNFQTSEKEIFPKLVEPNCPSGVHAIKLSHAASCIDPYLQ